MSVLVCLREKVYYLFETMVTLEKNENICGVITNLFSMTAGNVARG